MEANDSVDMCLKLAGRAHGYAVRIYNMILEVGHGGLTADNALHQLVEDYHDLRDLGDLLMDLAHRFEAEVK